MQCTKQLKTSAEATSFQLTCKIIVFFCNSWVSFGKEQPKLNCGGQIAKKIMVNELQWLLKMGVSISFSCYDISVYSLHMPLELAISNYSVT